MIEMVRQELTRRMEEGKQHNGASIFTGKIICGCCGGRYGSKVWHSNSKYHRVIWQCNAKFKDGYKCKTPYLTEEYIQQHFLKAYNQLLADRQFIAEDTATIMECLNA